MKIAKLFLLLATFGLLGLSSIETKAKAPSSIAGVAAVIQVTYGTEPVFASAGSSFLLLQSATDNTFGSIVLSGNGSDGYGTAYYTKTGTYTATINYNTQYPQQLQGFVAELTFNSSPLPLLNNTTKMDRADALPLLKSGSTAKTVE